jgi:hypothetical protein
MTGASARIGPSDSRSSVYRKQHPVVLPGQSYLHSNYIMVVVSLVCRPPARSAHSPGSMFPIHIRPWLDVWLLPPQFSR